MSGICGIVNFDGAPVKPEILREMADAAAHRGPDGIGYWREGSAGLANLALNITPESFHEHQPLIDRELVLTADARVDNRDELVPILTSRRYLQDKTATDADVILAAYRHWGEECPAHIIGDFAFAIWDSKRRRLFAACEPQGTRALYYRVEPGRVLFATEVKQILAVPGVPARIFEPAVGAFMAGGAGFKEWTYYQGISRLPAAHALAADRTGHHTWRYWDIDPEFRIEYGNEQEYADHFLEIFAEAVRCRLRSAKPVGILLSGGVDSGSVASTAGWLMQKNGAADYPDFRAYCWAFEELKQSDERHISDGIVDHYEFPVTYVLADTAWPLKDYPEHGPDRDDPHMPFFRVLADRTREAARADGTGWMLTGGLGDLMIGSDIFDYLDQLRQGRWWNLWNELLVHGKLWGVRRRKLAQMYLWRPLEETLFPPGRAVGLRHAWHRVMSTPKPYPEWIDPNFARRIGLADIMHDSDPRPLVGGYARGKRYKAAFSPYNTLEFVGWERSNARFGLGDADPFSDRRLVSFVIAVPPTVLGRAGELKLLARRSMYGVMPEDIRRGSGKVNPQPLLDVAMRRDASSTIEELITNPRAEAYGYIDGRTFADEVEAYRRGEHRAIYFWFTLALEMWLRAYWS